MNKVDETYLFIKRFLNEKGYPPTIREICKGIDIKSTSTISYYLKKLEDSNRIVKGSYKNRALQLTENVQTLPTQAPTTIENIDYISIPVLGTIAAGQPILADQNINENVIFSEDEDINLMGIIEDKTSPSPDSYIEDKEKLPLALENMKKMLDELNEADNVAVSLLSTAQDALKIVSGKFQKQIIPKF